MGHGNGRRHDGHADREQGRLIQSYIEVCRLRVCVERQRITRRDMSISRIRALTERATDFNSEVTSDLDELLLGYDELSRKKERAMALQRAHIRETGKAFDEAASAVEAISNIPLAGSEPSQPEPRSSDVAAKQGQAR